MDSHHPSTTNVDSLQNPGEFAGSEEPDDTKNIKRRKLETNPLKIGNILETIFSFLDADSIKNARQVNPLWSVEGAKVLITKCFVQIPSNLQIQDLSDENTELKEFKAFLSYKSKIPNISVRSEDEADLWKSLEVLGSQVKALKLNAADDQIDQAEQLRSLLDILTNLNNLRLEHKKYSATKMSIIEGITIVMTKPEKDGKPLLISGLSIMAQLWGLEEVEKLSKCSNIKLEDLQFDLYQSNFTGIANIEARIANVLRKLLSANQNTLKLVALDSCEVYLSLLDFPCLTNLNKISLKFESHNNNDILCQHKFSPSFRFAKKVPNLEILVIDTEEGKECFNDLFKETGISLSIKRFESLDLYADFLLDPIFQIFPNLEEVHTTLTYRSESMFESLCKKGKNLKKLEISVNLYLLEEYEPELDLDSFFTGFPSWTVDILANCPKWTNYTLEELNKLRTSSILDLEELKVLTIYFDGNKEDGLFQIGGWLLLGNMHLSIYQVTPGLSLMLQVPLSPLKKSLSCPTSSLIQGINFNLSHHSMYNSL